MRLIWIVFIILCCFPTLAGKRSLKKQKRYRREITMYNKLTPNEKRVILQKGTERPFTGQYYKHSGKGTYICKQCNAKLYKSNDKFKSGCGWPSFDDEIKGAVKRIPDADGRRTEIVCANCNAHLGHVFFGEGFTTKNTRHCVNSISLNFIKDKETFPVRRKPINPIKKERALFASGCFWGTEYQMQRIPGVISVVSGYTGGSTKYPSYKEVCTGKTGHAEAVEVIFDPAVTDYETIAKHYFETHDPSQLNRQGPDIGTQYRSEIFYTNDKQKEIAEKLIEQLKKKGVKVVTKLSKAKKFWEAEDYHQDYYSKTGKKPYCHIYKKKF